MSSGLYTCITCRVAFSDADFQRAHYKSDWHRYNLKRKVADLQPVTAENFQKRVLAQRAQVEEDGQDKSCHCTVCNKHFNSKNAFLNHQQSKKHKELEAKQMHKSEKNTHCHMVERKNLKNEANQAQCNIVADENGDMGMDSDSESVESWEGEALGEEECLFCSHLSSSLEENIKHMTTTHSFFIPDIEYLDDLTGLIIYLGQKVGEGHVCLWCNEKGKAFESTKSVQQHMLAKGHCKLLHEGEAVFEYADFYDYTSSYPDEIESDEVAMDTVEAGASGSRDEGAVDVLDDSGYQLVLPSGYLVGHRSLHRYYRQKLKPERRGNRPSLSSVISHYKALGWTGSTNATAARTAKDVAFIQRIRAKQHIKIAKKNNNQKYFRPQVVF